MYIYINILYFLNWLEAKKLRSRKYFVVWFWLHGCDDISSWWWSWYAEAWYMMWFCTLVTGVIRSNSTDGPKMMAMVEMVWLRQDGSEWDGKWGVTWWRIPWLMVWFGEEIYIAKDSLCWCPDFLNMVRPPDDCWSFPEMPHKKM